MTTDTQEYDTMDQLCNKLDPSGEEDYVLSDGYNSVWIEVDSISVYIRKCGDSVIVELCETGHEDDSTLATCQATFPPN